MSASKRKSDVFSYDCDEFLKLIEELEPYHDTKESRVGESVRVIDAVQSETNWDILNSILPSNRRGRREVSNGDAIAKGQHDLRSLALTVIDIAKVIIGSEDNLDIEESIQICIGEFIRKRSPSYFPENIHFPGQRTVATYPSDIGSVLSFKGVPLYYAEAGGIPPVNRFMADREIEPKIYATTAVDPGPGDYTGDDVLEYDDIADDILGQIHIEVSSAGKSITFANFEGHGLINFPSAASAAVVADTLTKYAERRERLGGAMNAEVRDALVFLASQASDPDPPSRCSSGARSGNSGTSTSLSSMGNAPTLKGLIEKLLLESCTKLTDLDKKYYPSAAERKNLSQNLTMTPPTKMALSKEQEALLLLSPPGFSGSTPNRRGSRAAPAKGHIIEPDGAISANVLPIIAKTIELKLKRNRQNLIKLVDLAAAIYEKLRLTDREHALEQTIRLVLHLKSYGDGFQLRQINREMLKPEYKGQTLILTSPDRILLGLAGLYADCYEWNLVTLQRIGGQIIIRNYIRPGKVKATRTTLKKRNKSAATAPAAAAAAAAAAPAAAAAADGFTLIDVPGDGNCLFNAVAQALQDGVLDDDHIVGAALREAVANELTYNRDNYQPFILGSMRRHVAYIRRNGGWGGDPEIAALRRILNRPINVWIQNGDRLQLYGEADQYHQDGINIFYDGVAHYQTLMPLNQELIDAAGGRAAAVHAARREELPVAPDSELEHHNVKGRIAKEGNMIVSKFKNKAASLFPSSPPSSNALPLLPSSPSSAVKNSNNTSSHFSFAQRIPSQRPRGQTAASEAEFRKELENVNNSMSSLNGLPALRQPLQSVTRMSAMSPLSRNLTGSVFLGSPLLQPGTSPLIQSSPLPSGSPMTSFGVGPPMHAPAPAAAPRAAAAPAPPNVSRPPSNPSSASSFIRPWQSPPPSPSNNNKKGGRHSYKQRKSRRRFTRRASSRSSR